MLARIGKPGRPQDTCLIYGTADAGMVAHETPTTIAVRRLAERDPSLRAAVLGGAGPLPTFVEYDPELRYVETETYPRRCARHSGTFPVAALAPGTFPVAALAPRNIPRRCSRPEEHSPSLRSPQEPAERLLFTVDSVIPLICYRINDVGSVLTSVDLATTLSNTQRNQ